MASLRETIPLQKSKVIKKSLGATIGLIVVAGFIFSFFVGFLFGAIGVAPQIRVLVLIVFSVFFLLLLCWTPVYEQLYFTRYFYDMDDKNITIRKGVVAQKEITLPFSRITDVFVDQDVFDAMFGLYDVHISTPTQASGLFAHIDGVNKVGSQQLREMILERINRDKR
jgi:uncharacterized membrane protein YdbT with pleckstrin-like domain